MRRSLGPRAKAALACGAGTVLAASIAVSLLVALGSPQRGDMPSNSTGRPVATCTAVNSRPINPVGEDSACSCNAGFGGDGNRCLPCAPGTFSLHGADIGGTSCQDTLVGRYVFHEEWDGRPSYALVSADPRFLYFWKSRNAWYLSSSLGSTAYRAFVNSSAANVSDFKSSDRWQEFCGGVWVSSGLFLRPFDTSRCLKCPDGTFSGAGASSCASCAPGLQSLQCEESSVDTRPLTLPPSPGCNRLRHLCSRRFSSGTFATLHNAFAVAAEFFAAPNHERPMAEALMAGARGLMLDVHLVDRDTIKICHGFCILGSAAVADVLTLIARFLEENPREIVALLWETQVKTQEGDIDRLKQLWQRQIQGSRLAPFLHVQQSPEEQWPTLEQMIEAGARLVQFSDHKRPGDAAWDLHMWDYIVDTPYDSTDKGDLEQRCVVNRGSATNPLFLLNHFVRKQAIATREEAVTVNYNPFLLAHTRQCAQKLGKVPNFVAIDYWSHSDLFEAVSMLNAPGGANVSAGNVSAGG